MAEHQEDHLSPFGRLLQLFETERRDLVALLVYVALSGLLSLAVPLAAQALVNTIAAGVFLQPLVVLTLIVFGCLAIAGLLRLFKLSLLERMQKRVFARVALKLAARLPRVEHSALLSTYAPQLVNRFFDVLTIQKTLAKILIDAPAAVLQIAVGLLLMAFYSPYLLAFDLFIILFLIAEAWPFGVGGLQTSIRESYAKYGVAEWLEEIARCQVNFKTFAANAFPIKRADNLVMKYIAARKSHFNVIYRQAVAHFLFRAIASAGVLAIGGWLVINRQMTLGQLVAANLIVVSVLAAIDKLISLLESYYDLLTALDKVGHLTDLPVDADCGAQLLTRGLNTGGVSVSTRGTRFSYQSQTEVLSNLNLEIAANERVSIVGRSGAGKSTLAALLCGLLEPSHGAILLDGKDVREIDLNNLHDAVALVGDSNEVFEGTIEENILLGREVAREQLQWALDAAQLGEDLGELPRGVKTEVISEGRNLSRGQIQRILIARAIVARPRLLILDEAFTGIDEGDKLEVLDELFDKRNSWTIINISHDPEVVTRTAKIFVLERGRIVETVDTDDLDSNPIILNKLFPTLATTARGFAKRSLAGV